MIHYAIVTVNPNKILSPVGSVVQVSPVADALIISASDMTRAIDDETTIQLDHPTTGPLNMAIAKYNRLALISNEDLDVGDRRAKASLTRNMDLYKIYGYNSILSPKTRMSFGIAIIDVDPAKWSGSMYADSETATKVGGYSLKFAHYIDYASKLSVGSVSNWEDQSLHVEPATDKVGWVDTNAWVDADLQAADTVDHLARISDALSEGTLKTRV